MIQRTTAINGDGPRAAAPIIGAGLNLGRRKQSASPAGARGWCYARHGGTALTQIPRILCYRTGGAEPGGGGCRECFFFNLSQSLCWSNGRLLAFRRSRVRLVRSYALVAKLAVRIPPFATDTDLITSAKQKRKRS